MLNSKIPPGRLELDNISILIQGVLPAFFRNTLMEKNGSCRMEAGTIIRLIRV